MAKLISVNHFIINPKEYNGRRVITFKDIDLVHGRADGTERYRFRDNKKHFIEGEDCFVFLHFFTSVLSAHLSAHAP